MTYFDQCYKDIYYQLQTYGRRQNNTKIIDAFSFEFDTEDYIPLLTLRRINLNSLVADFLWQMSGSSNVNDLGEKAFIWQEWANIEGFLQSSYGRHLRFSPSYEPANNETVATRASRAKSFFNPNLKYWPPASAQTVDQVRYVIEELHKNPNSRRAIIDIWHPANAMVANQPPCLLSIGFYLEPTDTGFKLNCHPIMRSSDFGLGFVFDIMHFFMLSEVVRMNLNHRVQNYSEVTKGVIYFHSMNFHLYDNQVEQINSFITKKPTNKEPQMLPVFEERNGIFEAINFGFSNYEPHSFVRVKKTIN